MSLTEFDKQTVELLPDKIIVPGIIELPQYQVVEERIKLEYKDKGNILAIHH